MRSPLCVLTPEIGVLSETFIAWDVNELLPGRTVVVADPPPNGETATAGPSWTTNAPRLVFDPVGGDPLPTAERRRALAEFLREHGVEVVLIEFIDFAERWFDTLHELDVRTWVRAHGADASARLSNSYQQFNTAAGLTAPSRAIANRLASVGLHNEVVHVVPNHVAVSPQPPVRRPTRDVVRCICVGRLVPKKGQLQVLSAFEQLASTDPGAHLEIIGDGPLRRELEDRIEHSDLSERVTMSGALSHCQVTERLAAADIFIHLAATGPDGDVEGMPTTILEAMAAGLPAVLTRHENLPDIIGTSGCALLTDEGDIDMAAEAIRTLVRDAELRHEFGSAAWRRALDRFSHDAVRPQLIELLGLDPVR